MALLLILLAGGLASRAGKVETTSDPAVVLPEGAESVRALRAIERFPSGDVTSAVVVAFRRGGLTGADRDRLVALRRELGGSAAPPRYSENGSAAVLVSTFRDLGEDRVVAEAERIRRAAARLDGGGLELAVTGGAGFAADVEGVFGGIDGILLIGAGTLVLILLVLIYRSPIFWVIPFFTVLLAEGASRGSQYFLGEAGLALTGQATGIASVLTFGAATDYALLLVARYREELVREEEHRAMRSALRSAGPAIAASADGHPRAADAAARARGRDQGARAAVGRRRADGDALQPDRAAGDAPDRRPARLLAADSRATARLPRTRGGVCGDGSESGSGGGHGRSGSAAPPSWRSSRSG